MSIIDVLNQMIPVEILDGSNVDEVAKMVDLDIAFTPVLPDPIGCDPATTYYATVPTPCRVQAEGLRWCVWMPHSPEKYRWTTDDELKVMRARYLLMRGFYYRTIENMSHSHRLAVIAAFFPVGLFKPDCMKQLESK